MLFIRDYQRTMIYVVLGVGHPVYWPRLELNVKRVLDFIGPFVNETVYTDFA